MDIDPASRGGDKLTRCYRLRRYSLSRQTGHKGLGTAHKAPSWLVVKMAEVLCLGVLKRCHRTRSMVGGQAEPISFAQLFANLDKR